MPKSVGGTLCVSNICQVPQLSGGIIFIIIGAITIYLFKYLFVLTGIIASGVFISPHRYMLIYCGL